jgi:hypothetical protein
MCTNADTPHLSGKILFGVAAGYIALNVITVWLAARGVIPLTLTWDVFLFFSWIGPGVLLVGLALFQITTQRRFVKLPVIVFALVVALAALINWYIYGLALASV